MFLLIGNRSLPVAAPGSQSAVYVTFGFRLGRVRERLGVSRVGQIQESLLV